MTPFLHHPGMLFTLRFKMRCCCPILVISYALPKSTQDSSVEEQTSDCLLLSRQIAYFPAFCQTVTIIE